MSQVQVIVKVIEATKPEVTQGIVKGTNRQSNHVETSHRHESKLIIDYKNKLFVDGQSYYPYYVAALLASNLECIMKQDQSLKDMRPYKMHLLFLIQELSMGPAPDINDKERIEEYCRKLLKLLGGTEYKQAVSRAAGRFRQIMNQWVAAKGSDYRYAIKDNPEFKDFMLRKLRGNSAAEENSDVYTGRVMTVTTDKYGNLFGFIPASNESSGHACMHI